MLIKANTNPINVVISLEELFTDIMIVATVNKSTILIKNVRPLLLLIIVLIVLIHFILLNLLFYYHR